MNFVFSYFFQESRIFQQFTFVVFVLSVFLISYFGSPSEDASGIMLQIQVTWDDIRQKDLLRRLQPFLYLAPVFIWLTCLSVISPEINSRTERTIANSCKLAAIISTSGMLDIALSTNGFGTLLVAILATVFYYAHRSLKNLVEWRVSSTLFLTFSLLTLFWLCNARRLLIHVAPDAAGFEALRSIGTVNTVYLVLATAICLMALVTQARVLALGFCLWMGYITIYHNLEHRTELRQLPAGNAIAKGVGNSGVALQGWLRRRSDLQFFADRGKPYPVFLVASEGGGGYAAAHSYLFLKSVENQLAPLRSKYGISFSDHIFALTGASGGAVGNAIYWANTYGDVQSKPECAEDIGLNYFQTDFLTPIVASLLLEEVPRRFLGLNQSAVGGRFNVLRRQLETGDDCVFGISNINYFEHFWQFNSTRSSLDPWEVNGNAALMPITTNVGNGRSYLFSPFEIQQPISGLNSDFGYYQDFRMGPRSADNRGIFIPSKNKDVGLSSVVTASAAFPYVSPSLALPLPPLTPHYCVGDHHPACRFSVENPAEPPRQYGRNTINEDGELEGYRLLVDGGYSDNTGGNVLFSIETAFRRNETGSVLVQKSTQAFKLPENLNRCSIRLADVPVDYPGGMNGFSWSSNGDCSIPVTVSYIMIGASWQRPEMLPVDEWHQPVPQSFLINPLQTLLGVQNDASVRPRSDLRSLVCPKGAANFLKCEMGTQAERTKLMSSLVDVSESKLPLGWHLTKNNISAIERTGSANKCHENPTSRACQSLIIIRGLLAP